MDKLLELINKDSADKFLYLRINSFDIYSFHRRVVITLLIPSDIYDKEYNDDYFNQLKQCIIKYIPEPFTAEISLKKSYIDCEVVTLAVYQYILDECMSAAGEIKKNAIEVTNEKGYRIIINAPKHIYTYLVDKNFEDSLKKYLLRNFCEDKYTIILRICEEKDCEGAIYSKSEDAEEVYIPKIIEVEDVDGYIGAAIAKYPNYISNSAKDIENTVICGKLTGISRRISKAEKVFYTFTATDPTGLLNCIYFPRLKDGARFESIKEGTEALMDGSVKRDKNGSFTFWLNKLSYCKINWESSTDINYKNEPIEYKVVFPNQYVDSLQSNFFGVDEIPTSLLKKDFVVFDTETTGLDTSSCKILELAACRIEKGHIVSTFSTFVNPSEPVPPIITEITSITDDDVKNAPLPNVVMADFYKFSRGAALVAHNAPFDMPILVRVGRDSRYKFDNEIYDTLHIAKKNIFNQSSYKLESLCERFSIQLIGAHRAINDVLATAKLFIKLAEYID